MALFVKIWVSYVISSLVKETVFLRSYTNFLHATLSQYRAMCRLSNDTVNA